MSTLSVGGGVAAAHLHQLARAVLRHGGQPGRYRYSALWVYNTAVVHCGMVSPVVCTLAEVLAEAEGGEGDAAQAAGHHGGQAAAL